MENGKKFGEGLFQFAGPATLWNPTKPPKDYLEIPGENRP
jgi:hypothetical protein